MYDIKVEIFVMPWFKFTSAIEWGAIVQIYQMIEKYCYYTDSNSIDSYMSESF